MIVCVFFAASLAIVPAHRPLDAEPLVGISRSYGCGGTIDRARAGNFSRCSILDPKKALRLSTKGFLKMIAL